MTRRNIAILLIQPIRRVRCRSDTSYLNRMLCPCVPREKPSVVTWNTPSIPDGVRLIANESHNLRRCGNDPESAGRLLEDLLRKDRVVTNVPLGKKELS